DVRGSAAPRRSPRHGDLGGLVSDGANGTSHLPAAKATAARIIQELREPLLALSHYIHKHPEIAFQERESSAAVAGFLAQHGFNVRRPYLELETAFRAEAGHGEPTVAIIAEYDALPGIGHACGHNIIAAAAAGAAIAAARSLQEAGAQGRIIVFGCPAEEVGGGKAILIERGAFSDVHAAMMVHPANRDIALVRSLAMLHLVVRYEGRASHAAAAPSLGRNALDAIVLAYGAIGLLRQQVRETARIHGVITDGGKAANIIPDRTAGSFMIRAEENEYLEELRERVLACFRAGAEATGCRLEHEWAEAPYLALNSNAPLAEAYLANLRTTGREAPQPSGVRAANMGSTDMGNVSWVVPSIHPSLAVAPAGVPIHTPEFAVYAAAAEGDRAVMDGATALALTAIDVLLRPELREAAQESFERSCAAR
ncbi:MAG TPA: M20 family metallopeptidase, partial [Dehalococcoidia bacterium]|nr:M20 family metallopeptidase [Dehalococcoidia bacterium]